MKKINTIKLDGNNNVIIQGVEENGQVTVNTVSWDDFVKKYTIELHERIEEQQKLLARSEELFDLKTLQLSGEINKLQAELDSKEEQIKEMIRQYEKVDLSQTSTLYQQAFALFVKGKLDNALAVLDEAKLDEQEKQQAEARVLKANILQLQNDFENAEKNLLRAVEIYPSAENFFALGRFYQFQNRFGQATDAYNKCLGLAETDDEKAATLNNLGNLQRDQNGYSVAQESYKEALTIWRELARVNPQTYLSDVATTLNNLGNLQRDQNEYSAAQSSYEEALTIYREFVRVDPQTWLPDIAMTLNNLGILQWNKNEYLAAQANYEESLTLRRELARVNPQTYLPDVASTLNNLAILQRDQNEYPAAQLSYKESLTIYRELAQVNPQTYLPDVAMTLNNLGMLQRSKNDYYASQSSYEEAITIWRELAQVNPQTWLPKVAITLNDLGNLQCVQNEYSATQANYEEALQIRRELARVNPKTYLPNLALTLINLAVFFLNFVPNKELSLQYVEEAIDILIPFREIPYIQNYLQNAFAVLRDWGIDPEEYMQKKRSEG
jgi:tetratricopeptide (TPR) repeat protein